MNLSFLQSLKAGPPPPSVVLLPDALFFTRAVPVPAAATAADVSAQVELALETLSPFPPAQLYHGFYWVPGAERALVFAAYRRRFTNEDSDGWGNAELVLPAFASLLGGTVTRDTTLVVPSAEGLTAIFWDEQPVPARVVFRPLPAEANEVEIAAAREGLLAQAPQNRSIVLAAGPAVEASRSERELVFRAEGFVSRLPVARAAAMDVRDKDALQSLRRGQRRDLVLWRTFLGFAAMLLLLGIAELALVGADVWQKTRVARVDQQRPVVERIMTAQSLTTRINDLSTKRLLPFEMIDVVTGKKPEEIWFSRVSTMGLYGLIVDGYSNSPAAVPAFRSALSNEPAFQKVEFVDQRTRDNVTTFSVTVTFRPEALKPTANP